MMYFMAKLKAANFNWCVSELKMQKRTNNSSVSTIKCNKQYTRDLFRCSNAETKDRVMCLEVLSYQETFTGDEFLG